ncbi:MAG: hypothetical protein VKI42_00205, partial [Synechococcaceae cyanobacterium]|nr:hypothetical protein [Synechococcaceae cyanobacterium]
PLDPQAAPGLGGEMLAILRERGVDALPQGAVAAYWSTRVQQHLVRYVSTWQSLLDEAAATGQGHLTVYGLRHGFAWRGSQVYGLSPRVLAKLMGHNPETHLRHYGAWSSEAETAAAVEAARARLMGDGTASRAFLPGFQVT